MTLVLSSTVCLVYEVGLATHRAHASSLIVATAYVRFIRSTERMTTARPQPGQIKSGTRAPMEWTSPHSLPRENLSLTRPRPSRATPSALRTRTSCEENVTLPSNSPLGDAGSLPKETNRARAKSSIEDDRPTHVAEFSSSHESRWDPTPSRLRPQPPLPGPRAKVSTAAAATVGLTYCIVATGALTLSSA